MIPFDGLELPPQQGWICPKCGNVWAPWQPQCVLCSVGRTTFATSITTHCKYCRKWVDMRYADGMIKACELTEMATKPDDYCSYAEAIDNADGETPLSR